MGQALYRKYRSKSLKEIIGQEHITDTLKHAITSGRISHAYLFTGPRGVGKTSIARILAHELNNVPYTDEATHLDIIEIDAATSGGVEEVRDLREKVYLAPASGKYRVYIIDEVHMMTTAAFNALLKTLEEPPAHVVFILATTEAHKLPATVISRTQRFTFKPIPVPKAVAHLRHIADQEKINISDDALQLIAEHGSGSFRDSISILDQVSNLHTAIDRIQLEQVLGIPPLAASAAILAALERHDAATLITTLTSLRASGYQAAAIAKQLGESLRSGLIDQTLPLSSQQVLRLLGRLIDVPASANPDQLLELILLEIALDGGPVSPSAHDPASKTVVAKALVVAKNAPPKAALATPEPANISEPITKSQPKAHAKTLDAAVWQEVLTTLKKQYNTLHGIICTAQPAFAPGRVTLTFSFSFSQKRANDTKNKAALLDVIRTVTGQITELECLYDKTIKPLESAEESASPATETSPMQVITQVFGGGEVL